MSYCYRCDGSLFLCAGLQAEKERERSILMAGIVRRRMLFGCFLDSQPALYAHDRGETNALGRWHFEGTVCVSNRPRIWMLHETVWDGEDGNVPLIVISANPVCLRELPSLYYSDCSELKMFPP